MGNVTGDLQHYMENIQRIPERVLEQFLMPNHYSNSTIDEFLSCRKVEEPTISYPV